MRRTGLAIAALVLASALTFLASYALADINCTGSGLCEGNDGNNTINGNANYNDIRSKGGDDDSYGNAAYDVVGGGSGADLVDGGDQRVAVFANKKNDGTFKGTFKDFYCIPTNTNRSGPFAARDYYRTKAVGQSC